MKPLIGLAAAAISISAVAGFRPIHKAADYNQVIENADHQSQRVPPIGYDDSTGEWGGDWNDNGQFVPPTQPGVDLIPPPEPEPDITEYTINCGCAKIWAKADGEDIPMSGACFKPERARGSMGSAYFNASYGNFWLDGNMDFIATFNVEGESPVISKIEISNGSEQKVVTSDVVDLNLFAFEEPVISPDKYGQRSCGVQLINPARKYVIYSQYSRPGGGNSNSSDRYQCIATSLDILAGYDNINVNTAAGTTQGRYRGYGSSQTRSPCRGIYLEQHFY